MRHLPETGIGFATRTVRERAAALLSALVLMGAVLATLAAAVAPAAGAAPAQSGGADVVAWSDGWSWTYAQTFTYSGGGNNVSMNETVTYTVESTDATYDGQSVYKVGLSGSVTGGGGSAAGYDLSIDGGSVSGTVYLRRSDLAVVYETQTHHLSGKVHESFLSVSFSADATINLTPSPAWRRADFRLHRGDSWHEDETIAYGGGFSYDASGIASGSSPFDGSMDLDATAHVGSGYKITASDSSAGTTDDVTWSPSARNISAEHMVLPVSGNTITMDRTLSSTNIGSASLSASASPSFSCKGGPVVISGALANHASGKAVTVTLDESPLGSGHDQVVHTTTTSGGAYRATLTAPTQADGFAKSGVRGSWGAVVEADGAVGATTVEVSPLDCTTLAYAGPTSAPHDTAVTVSATLSDPAGGSVSGRTVSFALSGQSPVTARTDRHGVASATLHVRTPARSATLQVSFAGTSSQESSSVSRPFTVKPDSTATSITSSQQSSTVGDPVTFTAHVHATQGAPIPASDAGAVQFTIDGSNLGAPVPLADGAATSPAASTMAIGSHLVKATYLGTNDYRSSSDQLTQHVAKALVHTTTDVATSPDSSVFGQSVTLTATVAPVSGTGLPTGSVTFTDTSTHTVLGSDTLAPAPGGDQASLQVSSLEVGNHTITASYQGDTTFASSTSSPSGLVVARADTTTSVSAEDATTVTGQKVTYSVVVAPVAPGAGVPTGSVQLSVDGSPVGSPVALSGGTATLAVVPTGSGQVAISVTYAGDAHFTASQGDTTQTIDKAATTTALDLAPTASLLGQQVQLTATVTAVAPGAGDPTGLVTFTDTTTGDVAGTAPLHDTPAGVKATLSTTSLALGSHDLTASYGGDDGFAASTSTQATETVSPVPPKLATTVELTALPDSATYGQTVQLRATVVPQAGLFGTPTGTVQFTVDGRPVGSPAQLDAQGVATTEVVGLAAGDHSLQASYSGADDFQPNGTTLTAHVDQASTTTVLHSSDSSPAYGDPVTFTATVSTAAPGTPLPSGTVQFTVDGAPLGLPAPLSGAGVATSPTTTTLGPGPHVVAAVYSGAADFLGSHASSLSQTVQAIPSTTTLTSSLNPSFAGKMITFTAIVTPSSGDWYPTGAVTFLDGSTQLGTAPLLMATDGTTSSSATLSLSTLAVGPHPITAVYDGDVDVAASTSAVVTQQVNKGPTTTTLTSSPNPSTSGQAVTFTASVVPAAGTAIVPTGTVQFFDVTASGLVLIGKGTLHAGSDGNTATTTTSTLSVGSHVVLASYGGDGNDVGSVSVVDDTQVVTPAPSSVALTATPNPSVFGQEVTFTATVSGAAGSATPGGTVTFRDGSRVLGTETLSGGSATLSTSALPVGTHHVTAAYGGDATHTGATSPVATQTVHKAATATSLSSSPNPSTYHQKVTFTATVAVDSPGAGSPTGSVRFSDGTHVLATAPLSGGTASFATASLIGGAHHVTATYLGDDSFAASTSAAMTQTVQRIATSLHPNAAVLELHLFGPSTLLKLKAGLTTADGTPLAGRTLTFTAGATTLCSGVTDSGGVATCGPGGVGELAVILNGGFTVSFAGDDGYQPSSAGAGLVHIIGLG